MRPGNCRLLLLVLCLRPQVSDLVRLRVLDVEGCEGLSSACLPHLAPLTRLTHLNLGQCSGLKGHNLHHIAGELAGLQQRWLS